MTRQRGLLALLLAALLVGPAWAQLAERDVLAVVASTQQEADRLSDIVAGLRQRFGLSKEQAPIVFESLDKVGTDTVQRLGFTKGDLPVLMAVRISSASNMKRLVGDPPILLRRLKYPQLAARLLLGRWMRYRGMTPPDEVRQAESLSRPGYRLLVIGADLRKAEKDAKLLARFVRDRGGDLDIVPHEYSKGLFSPLGVERSDLPVSLLLKGVDGQPEVLSSKPYGESGRVLFVWSKEAGVSLVRRHYTFTVDNRSQSEATAYVRFQTADRGWKMKGPIYIRPGSRQRLLDASDDCRSREIYLHLSSPERVHTVGTTFEVDGSRRSFAATDMGKDPRDATKVIEPPPPVSRRDSPFGTVELLNNMTGPVIEKEKRYQLYTWRGPSMEFRIERLEQGMPDSYAGRWQKGDWDRKYIDGLQDAVSAWYDEPVQWLNKGSVNIHGYRFFRLDYVFNDIRSYFLITAVDGAFIRLLVYCHNSSGTTEFAEAAIQSFKLKY